MAKIKHVGRWASRLAPNCENPREVAFAEQWKCENELQALTQLVCTRPMTAEESARDMMPWLSGGYKQDCKLTQRDAEVAATVIQWLGSNVGWSFLSEALDRCGYKIVEKGRRRG